MPPSAKICLLKKPSSICQFGWREIWNAFPASNSLSLSGGPVSSRVALPPLYFECFVLQSQNMSGELLTFPLRPSTSILALLCRRYYRGLNYVCRRRVLNRKHNLYKYSLAALNDWLDDCSQNGVCINVNGSFQCECQPGFTGDGKACNGRLTKNKFWNVYHKPCYCSRPSFIIINHRHRRRHFESSRVIYYVRN